MGSKAGGLLKTIAPLALNYFAPGIGSALGTALGATGATAAGLGSGLIGAGFNAVTGGGLKGAAIGGLTSGLGGYAGAGGFDGTAIGDGAQSAYDGLKGAGNSISNGLGFSDIFSGGSGLSGASYNPSTGLTKDGSILGNNFSLGGSGIGADAGNGFSLGAAPAAINGAGSSIAGAAGGGSSSFSSAAPYLGIANSLYANNQAQDALEKSTKQGLATLSPYTTSGAAANAKLSDFLGTSGNGTSTADILASNPAYQFQLQQGTDALNRKQAASGGYFSGQALQAAQDYGQGLANQTAQDYYARLAQASGQGQQAAGSAAGLYANQGMNSANAGISSANIVNQGLSTLFGAGRTPYYDSATGQIRYR